MKYTIHYILAIMLLLAVACSSSSFDEPRVVNIGVLDGRIALRAVEGEQSRAGVIKLNGNSYDIFALGVLYNAEGYNGYYTLRDNKIYHEMVYDDSLEIFYIPTFFFPLEGDMDIFSYGVTKGKTTVKPSAFPTTLPPDTTARYMTLDLTQGYDGRYDVIAADRIYVPLSTDLTADNLPYGHFHHIMAHISIKVKWASDVPSNADIVSRFYINKVSIQNTSSQGVFCMPNTMADAFWKDQGDDVEYTNINGNKLMSYSKGVDLGGRYVVPQAKRRNFVVNYSIKNGSGEKEQLNTMNYVVGENSDEPWLAGHKYTYEISIGKFGTVEISNVKVQPIEPGEVGPTIIN